MLPICNTLEQIPPLADSTPSIKSYIEDEFGSVDNAVREILCDFFRHGFDGSGADSFYDAGKKLISCIFRCLLMSVVRFMYRRSFDQCMELVFTSVKEKILSVVFADW